MKASLDEKTDPYGQGRIAAEVLYARSQSLRDDGALRAAQEVRWCAKYLDDKFGSGEMLPPQATLQLAPLEVIGDRFVEGLVLLGAHPSALVGLCQMLLRKVEAAWHKVNHVSKQA